MKLYVGVKTLIDKSYTNAGFVKNLDAFAEDAECDEIYAPEILSYIPHAQSEVFIVHVLRKIRHGGKVTFGGQDAIEIAKMLLRGDFNVTEFNHILYGDKDARPRENTMTLQMVSNILQSNGFKVMKKRLDNYQFIIEAERL